jgi:hypothetical protein
MARNNRNLGELLATDEDVPALKPRSKAAQAAAANGEKIVRIVLEENENIPPTGQFIAVNGRTFMLRPGDEADVPECVLGVLNDAIQDVPQIDPFSKQVIGYRKKLRFPYRIVQPQAA